MMKRTSTLMLTLAMGCLGGCASYYRVEDPTSDRVYYTRQVGRSGSRGFVKFKDGKTGAEVTLHSSEVAKISEYEFNKSVSESGE